MDVKRSQSKFETTITLANETKKKLEKIKRANDCKTYDETIQEILAAKQGLIDEDFEILQKPRIAIILKSIELKPDGSSYVFEEYEIYYSDLKNAEINREYSPSIPKSENYHIQTAKIIYKNDDLILIQINEIIKTDQINEFNDIIAIELL